MLTQARTGVEPPTWGQGASGGDSPEEVIRYLWRSVPPHHRGRRHHRDGGLGDGGLGDGGVGDGGRAGTPTAVVRAGTSSTTTALAPTNALAPTRTGPMTFAPVPMFT